MKSTVFCSAALVFLIGSLPASPRGLSAAEEVEPRDPVARKEGSGQRVHLPIKGAEFYARSIRLAGTKVIADGDLRARLEQFPRVEIRAARLEYRVGGDKVRLHEPVWVFPVGDEKPSRLNVRAASATFHVEDETVVAKSVRIETTDGGLSLEARSGTWRSRSRDCLLESIEGDVFTTTDETGRGSLERESFRVRIDRASVQLSPDLTLEEIRLDRISGVERKNAYVFEARSGVLDSSHGGRPREARLMRVSVAGPGGQTIECEKLTYRPPDPREPKKREP